MPPRPALALIRSPADAEAAAAQWMRYWGFADAEVTNVGPDSGIDVRARDAVAQVKAYQVPVGRPDIQRLQGVRSHANAKEALFFALTAYTAQAVAWADEVDIALFRFDLQGEPKPVNPTAHRVAATTEADPFRDLADHYRESAKRRAELNALRKRAWKARRQLREDESPTTDEDTRWALALERMLASLWDHPDGNNFVILDVEDSAAVRRWCPIGEIGALFIQFTTGNHALVGLYGEAGSGIEENPPLSQALQQIGWGPADPGAAGLQTRELPGAAVGEAATLCVRTFRDVFRVGPSTIAVEAGNPAIHTDELRAMGCRIR